MCGGKVHEKYEHPARPRPFTALLCTLPGLRPGRVHNKYIYFRQILVVINNFTACWSWRITLFVLQLNKCYPVPAKVTHRSTWVKEYRSRGIQEYRSTGVQEYSCTGAQEYRSIEVQEFSSNRTIIQDVSDKQRYLDWHRLIWLSHID